MPESEKPEIEVHFGPVPEGFEPDLMGARKFQDGECHSDGSDKTTPASGDGTRQKSGQLPTLVQPEGAPRRDEASPAIKEVQPRAGEQRCLCTDCDPAPCPIHDAAAQPAGETDERKRCIEDIQDALGNWGGPERQHYTAAMHRAIDAIEKRAKGLDLWGHPAAQPADGAREAQKYCANCGCSYAQHTKGISKVKYCRHCPCGEWVEPAVPQAVQQSGERVRELVAKWRDYVKKINGIATTGPYHEGMKVCADELEAALAATPERLETDARGLRVTTLATEICNLSHLGWLNKPKDLEYIFTEIEKRGLALRALAAQPQERR